jgi:hypothetical protein
VFWGIEGMSKERLASIRSRQQHLIRFFCRRTLKPKNWLKSESASGGRPLQEKAAPVSRGRRRSIDARSQRSTHFFSSAPGKRCRPGALTKTAKPRAQLEKHRGSAWTNRLRVKKVVRHKSCRIRATRFLTSIKESLCQAQIGGPATELR